MRLLASLGRKGSSSIPGYNCWLPVFAALYCTITMQHLDSYPCDARTAGRDAVYIVSAPLLRRRRRRRCMLTGIVRTRRSGERLAYAVNQTVHDRRSSYPTVQNSTVLVRSTANRTDARNVVDASKLPLSLFPGTRNVTPALLQRYSGNYCRVVRVLHAVGTLHIASDRNALLGNSIICKNYFPSD